MWFDGKNKEQEKKQKTAVAVAYEPGDAAPKILAAGKGEVAERIIEKAKENDAYMLLTGFGINDSIAGFADRQYDEIQISDGTMTLAESVDDVKKTNAASEENQKDQQKATQTGSESAVAGDLYDKLDKYMQDYDFVGETSWDLIESDGIKSINLVIMKEPEHCVIWYRITLFSW